MTKVNLCLTSLKICYGCNSPKKIWKNHRGKKFCKRCWSCHKGNQKQKPTAKRKSISPRSPKRVIEEVKYSKLRRVFLDKHSLCQAALPNCTGVSTDIHHTYVGSNRNKYYLDVTTWRSVCRTCHDWIHNHSKESRELGLLK